MNTRCSIRGCVDPELYNQFVKLYNEGVFVEVIKNELGIGDTRYYKMFQRAQREDKIILRGRGRR